MTNKEHPLLGFVPALLMMAFVAVIMGGAIYMDKQRKPSSYENAQRQLIENAETFSRGFVEGFMSGYKQGQRALPNIEPLRRQKCNGV